MKNVLQQPRDLIFISVTMRRSTWFPMSSLVILLIGGTVCFVGNCNSSKRNLTFVSGILFVLAGKCFLSF